MPRNYKLPEMILKVLEDGEMSKRELQLTIIEKADTNVSDKTFNESLMNLLREGKIYLAGYDFSVYQGVKRIQSMRTEGIIFGLAITDFFEIESLLKQLESKEFEEVKKASSDLRRIFKRKIDASDDPSIKERPLDVIFNDTMYYINSQPEAERRILLNKLAWSLSNRKGSTELFGDILRYIEARG